MKKEKRILLSYAYTIFSSNHKAIMAGPVLFLLMLTAAPLHAEWIDDWIDQKTTTSADYFSGQKRGYATAGSFSARWSSGSDYLVSLTPPRFKAGCGGIDIFTGGASFLNADYLVDKLQSMMNSAPAVAFDLALNTMCEQCAKSLNTLEALSDRLNQLQFDDCKASKATVYTLAEGLTTGAAGERVSAKKTEAVADFAQSTGLNDFWTDIKNIGGNNANTTAGAFSNVAGVPESAQVSACPAAVRNLFFSSGSILSRLLANRNLDTAYADMMRGYIGDIVIDGATLNARYIAKCPNNTPNNIDGLVNGDVEIKPVNGMCAPMNQIVINGISYANVRDWIYHVLRTVATKMINKSPALTPDEEAFIAILPLSIYNAIVGDITSQGAAANPGIIADLYAEVVASAYAYVMITDLYDTLTTVIETGEVVIANTLGAQNPSQQARCNISLAAPTLEELKKMKHTLPEYVRAARNQYSAKLTEMVGYQQFNFRANETRKQIFSSLAEHFNAGVAHRMTR